MHLIVLHRPAGVATTHQQLLNPGALCGPRDHGSSQLPLVGPPFGRRSLWRRSTEDALPRFISQPCHLWPFCPVVPAPRPLDTANYKSTTDDCMQRSVRVVCDSRHCGCLFCWEDKHEAWHLAARSRARRWKLSFAGCLPGVFTPAPRDHACMLRFVPSIWTFPVLSFSSSTVSLFAEQRPGRHAHPQAPQMDYCSTSYASKLRPFFSFAWSNMIIELRRKYHLQFTWRPRSFKKKSTWRQATK